MADYDWFDTSPSDAAITGGTWRAQGLHPVFEGMTMGGQPLRIKHYKCRRGCGTLVWDPQTHIKNVCTKWEPTVG